MFRNVYTDNLNVIKESQLLGSDDLKTVKVQDVQNLYNFLNGNRTEEVIGKRITVQCPDGKSLSVKLLNEVADLEQIQIGIKICLHHLTGKIYVDNKGRMALSCSAEGWEQVND